MALSKLPPKNRLLAKLPAQSYEHFLSQLEEVELPIGKILYHPKQRIDYVYFPSKSAVSMVNIFENGTTVEVGLVGSDGVVGVSILSGDDVTQHQAIVQMAGGGWRMKASEFITTLETNPELANVVRRFSQALFIQVAQTAACNRLHTIVQRLARWLLLCQDRMESDTLNLTHEFLSTMLGARRAGVTLAAGTLQNSGLIKYRRGSITILNRKKLEQASCECHGIVKAEYERLLGRPV